MKTIIAACALSLIAAPALADISVAFSEGAPKDRFTIANMSNCEIGKLTLVLDLSSSAAGLVFDVTDAGAGVEVFQPFELVSGSKSIIGEPVVRDGDNILRLELANFAKSEPVSFTIDVDDTLGGREITVSGSEIAGARFDVTFENKQLTGVFGENAVAVARMNSCVS